MSKKQPNLRDRIDQGPALSPRDLDQLTNLIGQGCHAKTRETIRRRLGTMLSLIPCYGILERVMDEPGGWTYCAGQSYPDEIREVKKIIIGRLI